MRFFFFFILSCLIFCIEICRNNILGFIGERITEDLLFSFLTAAQWGCNTKKMQDDTFPVWKLWIPTSIVIEKCFENRI